MTMMMVVPVLLTVSLTTAVTLLLVETTVVHLTVDKHRYLKMMEKTRREMELGWRFQPLVLFSCLALVYTESRHAVSLEGKFCEDREERISQGGTAVD